MIIIIKTEYDQQPSPHLFCNIARGHFQPLLKLSPSKANIMCITSLIIQLHLTTPPTPTLPSNKRLIPVPRGSLCLLKPYLSPICRYPMPKSAIKPASIIAQGTSVWLLCHNILLSRFTISDLKSREKIWNCIWLILNVIGILWFIHYFATFMCQLW